MELRRVGLDLAKNVFQVHGVDSHERVVVRRTLRRNQVLRYFSDKAPLLIGVEACGSAHYWARELMRQGHQVRLIPPQFVKPYVKSGKNDANDAEAICEAVSRPSMRFVSVKTPEQQAVQACHRVRQRLVRARTALVNEARGLLAEFGIALPVLGVSALRRALPSILEDGDNGLPWELRSLLEGLAEQLREHDVHLEALNGRIEQMAREDDRVRRLMTLDGIGPITATAVVAAVGDAQQFRSGRGFAAWLGIVPNQHSSGGRQRLGAISKRGDVYLRTLLVHGARAVVNGCERRTDRRSEWVKALVQRRNRNIATVALANKQARVIWAMLRRGEAYHPVQ